MVEASVVLPRSGVDPGGRCISRDAKGLLSGWRIGMSLAKMVVRSPLTGGDSARCIGRLAGAASVMESVERQRLLAPLGRSATVGLEEGRGGVVASLVAGGRLKREGPDDEGRGSLGSLASLASRQGMSGGYGRRDPLL